MNKVTVLPKPATATPGSAARLSFAATVAFLVLLATLHVLKPELDPSWRFISEYAIGNHGWLMMLAFFALAFGCLSLFAALKSQVKTLGGKVGLAFLLITAVGMAIAGIFPADPITTSREAMTPSGKIHEMGALLDLLPFASLLISWSLIRHNPAWSSARRALAWTAGLPLINLVVFMASVMMLLPDDGTFGPGVSVGLPNRFLMLTYCIWLMTVAWQANRLQRQSTD